VAGVIFIGGVHQDAGQERTMTNDPIDLVETKAIYVRTSTSDQDGAAQLHALHRAATARG